MLRLLFPANRSLRSGSIGPACSQKHLSAGRRRTVTPAAILDQMDWLVGQRRGMGIGDAPARESWLPSAGGTMVGTFVQENGKGGIQFTEHMYLLEEEGSLVLELKRFNADMTGWEEKDGRLTFPLKAIAPCFAEFGAVTFSCIAMGDPGRGLLITVKMKEGGELAFRLLRSDMGTIEPCMDAYDVPKQEACLTGLFARIDGQREKYFAAATENYTALAETIATRGYLAKPDPEGKPDLSIVENIRSGKEAFLAYRDAECGAVMVGMETTVSPNLRALTCSIRLTKSRTHTIWKNWLAGTKSTPGILPEPTLSH